MMAILATYSVIHSTYKSRIASGLLFRQAGLDYIYAIYAIFSISDRRLRSQRQSTVPFQVAALTANTVN